MCGIGFGDTISSSFVYVLFELFVKHPSGNAASIVVYSGLELMAKV